MLDNKRALLPLLRELEPSARAIVITHTHTLCIRL